MKPAPRPPLRTRGKPTAWGTDEIAGLIRTYEQGPWPAVRLAPMPAELPELAAYLSGRKVDVALVEAVVRAAAFLGYAGPMDPPRAAPIVPEPSAPDRPVAPRADRPGPRRADPSDLGDDD